MKPLATLLVLTLALILAILAFIPLSQARDKFCPLERNENQCRSKRNQYKCGAFFVNLQGQNETLRWLGAIPDILLKPNVRGSKSLRRKILGNGIHKKSFNLVPGYCNEIYANARCYTIMKKVSDIPLDSCAQSVLNDHGEQTLGNLLCQKAGLFAPGQFFQSFVQIGFYHSACGGNWTETHLKGEPLQLKEELCCKFEDGRGHYFRCDGSNYAKSCEPDTPPALIDPDDPETLKKYYL